MSAVHCDLVTRVAVTSRSFSRNPVLREELLKRYNLVTFNDAGTSLSGDALVSYLSGHEKAIVALERITEDVVSRLPDLKVLSKYGVGLDMIDMEALRRHGIRLGWRAGVNKRSVSEFVISTAIGLLRGLYVANQQVRENIWQQYVGGYLTGRTVGIVGLGNVGKDLAVLLKAFGCRILAHDILQFPAFCAEYGVTQVGLSDLLQQSDLVTLHVPLDDTTRGMFSAARLDEMRHGAYLVNAARGGIVDEIALKDRLKSRRIAAAAFDVFASEPPTDLELLRLPNLFATPHLGGSALEAILAMGRAAIDGLDDAKLP